MHAATNLWDPAATLRRRSDRCRLPTARSPHKEFIMQTRRVSLALLATLSASAALFIAQPAAAAQPKLDPYTQGAVDRTDPYTQGADRQADTYGYLSWKYDRYDPYGQGADRPSRAHETLAWRGDTRYPGGTDGART
jgi:uncharacterized protein YfaQ (DUF2300 family)